MAGYVELDALKKSLELGGESYADDDLTLAISAASAAVDNLCGRSFSLGDPDVTREYVTGRWTWVELDDCAAVSGIESDDYGNGTWTAWTADDYVTLPLNAAADQWPITALRLRPGTQVGPFCDVSMIRVRGTFGWPTVPDSIVAATSILATRLVKRVREAPFGVAGMGSDGIAIRIAVGDPDVAMLVRPYTRPTRLA